MRWQELRAIGRFLLLFTVLLFIELHLTHIGICVVNTSTDYKVNKCTSSFHVIKSLVETKS